MGVSDFFLADKLWVSLISFISLLISLEGKAEIVVYVEVDDLSRSFEKATRLGATVRIPPMEYGGLRFALIEDPEGNSIGLTQK